MTFNNLEFRVLRRLKLLNHLNISKKISFGKRKVTIPIVRGLGYPNLFIQPDWLCMLLNKFCASDGGTFIDVGANIGQTLIAVKSAKSKIQYVGFEPSIDCGYYLKLLIRENNFENCHVYNFALSDRLREDFLETNGDADPTGSLVQQLRPDFFKNRESIFSIAYDSLGLDKKVACVKIDVEGGELEVLLGMQELIARDRPIIVCEVLDSFSDEVFVFTQNRADRICHLLTQHDYSILQIVQNKKTDKIISFNEIDILKLKQWDYESLTMNDYIFYPSESNRFIRAILENLITH